MSVTIVPTGGLGNQLFIYSAGVNLALARQDELVVDSRNYLNNPERCFELDSFESEYRLKIPSHGDKTKLFSDRAKDKVSELIDNATLAASPTLRLNPAFVYRAPKRRRSRNLRLSGYFQSWRYFEDSAELIRQQVMRVQQPSEWFREALRTITGSNRSVAVHVRRGDYQSNPYMGVITESYYDDALSLVAGQGPDLQIFLFSDDHSLLEDPNFLARWRSRISVIQPPPESRAIESMVLMSHCENVVMANSSFSWWGAWLGHREKRMVIYPRPWLLGAAVDDRDLVLPSWVSLGYDVRI